MEKEVYEAFRGEDREDLPKVVTAEELSDGGDRTLTLGYDVDRATFHAYLEGGQIHALWYSSGTGPFASYKHGLWLPVLLLARSKRVYPEHTDEAFARLMRERTEYGLPFMTWSEPRREGPFRGRRFFG